MPTVYEVWDTDTFNLLGAYVGEERAIKAALQLRKKAQRRVKVSDTGMTKKEYNEDKKGMI